MISSPCMLLPLVFRVLKCLLFPSSSSHVTTYSARLCLSTFIKEIFLSFYLPVFFHSSTYHLHTIYLIICLCSDCPA
jgi:hypothetical protein